MIHHVLRTTQESSLSYTIHVSTDSPQIVEIVKKLGLGVEFMRPASLADAQTPIMPVLKYVIEEYHRRGFEYEQALMLMACAPLLEAENLHQAEKIFTAAGGS